MLQPARTVWEVSGATESKAVRRVAVHVLQTHSPMRARGVPRDFDSSSYPQDENSVEESKEISVNTNFLFNT